MAEAENEVLLEIDNYAASGIDSTVRTVIFGPASEEFSLLIQLDPHGGPLRLLIGNGPDDADLPRLLPDVIHDVAQSIENLADSDEFWSQISNHGQ